MQGEEDIVPCVVVGTQAVMLMNSPRCQYSRDFSAGKWFKNIDVFQNSDSH